MASVQPYTTKGGERRYAVRSRDANGKQRWKAVPGPKRNAEAVRRDLEAREALGPLYEAEPQRLGEFLEGWLERYSQRVRPATYRRRVEALKSVILPDEYLQRLTVAEIEDAIVATARRAPNQAQKALQALKMALRDAKARGQRFDEGLLAIKPPSYAEREPRFLTWPEVEELASWLPESVARIVPIAALTGMRQGELLALLEADVDLGASTVLVQAGKTAASKRTVDLPPLAVQLFREQLVARPHTEGLVFPAPRGGPWERDNFMARAFRPATKRAGLAGVTFHDLRHTAASLMIAARWHAKEIAEQLGHGDGGALVFRRYGHLYAGARKRAALDLDSFIQKVNEPEAGEAGA